MLPSASIEADASKVTLRGAAPVVGAAVNEAMGGALATVTVRVVEALQETLTADQETALLAASAIMREGEHNDVFRHMLRPVTGPDGSIVGYLGVNYPANPALGGSVSPAYLAGLLVLLTGLAAYWLSLPFWVLLDAGPRGERAWVWAAFVLVGNLVALMAYLLTRGQPLHGEPARAVRG